MRFVIQIIFNNINFPQIEADYYTNLVAKHNTIAKRITKKISRRH